MLKYFFIIFLIQTIVLGCDSPGYIEIENKLNKKISFSYRGEKFEIKPNEKNNIFYRLGIRWNNSTLKKFTKNINDTIKLTISEKEYLCVDKKCKSEIFNQINKRSKRKLKLQINSELINEFFVEK